eukprot:15269267-Alexandrium_andersonii.AAC.1
MLPVPEHGPGSGVVAPPHKSREVNSRIQDPSGFGGRGSEPTLIEIGVLDPTPLRQSSDFGDTEEGHGVAARLGVLKCEPRPLCYGD